MGNIGGQNAIRYIAECHSLPSLAAYTYYLKSKWEEELNRRNERVEQLRYERIRDNYFADQLWVLGAGLNFVSGAGKAKKPTYERFAEMLKRLAEDEKPAPKITKKDVKAQFMRLKRGNK